jgi:TatD DNase family protein
MLIDSHIHFSYKSDEDREHNFQAARELGAGAFVAVASDLEDAKKIVSVAEEVEDLYCGVGVHPRSLDTYSPDQLDVFRDLIRNSTKVVCIGETGLDYEGPMFGPPHLSDDDRAKCRDMFRDMITLAREFDLPLNMHSDRPSSQDLTDIFKEEKAYEVGGMIHNFQASPKEARKLLDLGIYISASVTLHHPLAERLRSVFKELSLGQMVLDSDSPGYVLPRAGAEGPFPYDMDKVSEPRMVRYIAEKVAELQEIPVEDVESMTSLNARRLFRLPA